VIGCCFVAYDDDVRVGELDVVALQQFYDVVRGVW